MNQKIIASFDPTNNSEIASLCSMFAFTALRVDYDCIRTGKLRNTCIISIKKINCIRTTDDHQYNLATFTKLNEKINHAQEEEASIERILIIPNLVNDLCKLRSQFLNFDDLSINEEETMSFKSFIKDIIMVTVGYFQFYSKYIH